MRRFLFLLPVCLLVALGGAELYFRLIDDQNYASMNGRWTEPYLGFGDIKGGPNNPLSLAGYEPEGLVYRWRPRSAVTGVLSHAPATFGRGFPESPERGPRSKWVVVMGASAALGDGSFARMFPDLLQEELEKGRPGLKVFTAATRSFVSTQERIALELYVLPLRPDAVVFLHGFNDVSQASFMARPGDPYNMGIAYARNENPSFGFLQLLSNYSRLLDHVFSSSVFRSLSEGRSKMSSEEAVVFSRSVASVYEDNVRRMAKRCEQEKIPCLFIFQPFRDFLAENGDESTRMAYHLVVEAFKRQPLRGSAAFQDMAPPYAGRTELFVDAVHMSEAGQVSLAKAVAGRLRKNGIGSGL